MLAASAVGVGGAGVSAALIAVVSPGCAADAVVVGAGRVCVNLADSGAAGVDDGPKFPQISAPSRPADTSPVPIFRPGLSLLAGHSNAVGTVWEAVISAISGAVMPNGSG